MTPSTFEVGDLLSILGAHGIEKQLKQIVGVGSVSVNPVSGSTTVAFDPAKTSSPAIEAAIKECGYHCAGEALPQSVWRSGSFRTLSKFGPTLPYTTRFRVFNRLIWPLA